VAVNGRPRLLDVVEGRSGTAFHVRRRVQRDTLGHRGYKHDPLFRIWRLLCRGFDHHTAKSWNRMLAGLESGDVDQ
jgi:hypothetical protein